MEKAGSLAEKRRLKNANKIGDHLAQLEHNFEEVAARFSVHLIHEARPSVSGLKTPNSLKTKQSGPTTVVTRSQKRRKGGSS